MTKEFMMSYDELKKEYKVGSISEIDGKKYKVVEIFDALPSTCFASFPGVVFEEIVTDKDINESTSMKNSFLEMYKEYTENISENENYQEELN